MSQITNTTDDFLNKRKHSLSLEKNIDAMPQLKNWRMRDNGFAIMIEKALLLASLPILVFAGFVILCLVVGIALFLALCQILAILLPATTTKPPSKELR